MGSKKTTAYRGSKKTTAYMGYKPEIFEKNLI